MFGGHAFLIAGNMAIAASSQGGAMVRVNPQQSDALVATTTASVVEMRGRPMPGHRVRAVAAAQTVAAAPGRVCRAAERMGKCAGGNSAL
jgi:hypothetical protein